MKPVVSMHLGFSFAPSRAPAQGVLAVVALLALQMGCTHGSKNMPAAETKVDYTAFSAPNSKHYELSDEESANVPVPREHPTPEYPAAMIPLHLALITVQAKVIVDAEGKVSEVRITPSNNPDAQPFAFDDAVRSAAMQWRFVPLRISRWEEVTDAEGNVTDSREVGIEKRTFSLDYEFTFELHDGKPVVGNRQHSRSSAK